MKSFGERLSRRVAFRSFGRPTLVFWGVTFIIALSLFPGCGKKTTDSSTGHEKSTSDAVESVASAGPASIRLVDIFGKATVETAAPAADGAVSGIEWAFSADTAGWIAGGGVTGLQVRDGLLIGRTTDEFPVIYAPVISDSSVADLVYSVEIRAKVSAGADLTVAFQTSAQADPNMLRAPCAGLMSAPLLAGAGMTDYSIRCMSAYPVDDLRHILVRPSDAPDVDFELESIKIKTLKQHMVETGAQLGWCGLSGVYCEGIVMKAPARMQFEIELQRKPWLDVVVGTIEEDPVTFKVTAGSVVVVEETVTAKDGWQPLRADLSENAGKKIVLTLSVEASQEGALGYWGSPAIRNSGAALENSAKDAPQGVILIMVDALRRDHLEAYGYGQATAPHLARMAADGVLFKDCIAQATRPEASVPSILTSLYPLSHTVRALSNRLPSSAETLAEVYREAGCATLSLSASPFTGQSANLHQGFEMLHENDSLGQRKSADGAKEYIGRLVAWLEGHQDVPFFACLHVAESETLTPDAYDHWIRAVDESMGELQEALERLGLASKTLVALVGTCGEELTDHGGTGHGHSVYGELTNVPLMLSGVSAFTPGHVVEETIQTIDLMPTFLEISGLSKPEASQGRSLLPLMGSGSGKWYEEPAVSELLVSSSGAAPGLLEAYGIVVGEWKLIHNTERIGETPEFELYNHREDPLDQKDVASGNAETVQQLRTELEGWRERALSSQLSSKAASTSDETPEELERLKSLGYL